MNTWRVVAVPPDKARRRPVGSGVSESTRRGHPQRTRPISIDPVTDHEHATELTIAGRVGHKLFPAGKSFPAAACLAWAGELRTADVDIPQPFGPAAHVLGVRRVAA